jgi:hypothetical protein
MYVFRGLYQQYDAHSNTKLFERMVTVLNKFVQRMFDWDEDEFTLCFTPSFGTSTAGKFRWYYTNLQMFYIYILRERYNNTTTTYE